MILWCSLANVGSLYVFYGFLRLWWNIIIKCNFGWKGFILTYTSIWQFIIKGRQRLKQNENLEGETEAQTMEGAAYYFIHCDLFRPLAFSFSFLLFSFLFSSFLPSFLLVILSLSLSFLHVFSPTMFLFTENRYFYHTICSDYDFSSEILPPLFPNKSTHIFSPHRIQIVI